MNLDERIEQSATYSSFRTSLDIAMGAIYIILGVILVSLRQFGALELSATSAWVLGAAMVLYGAFRIYRGITAIGALRRTKNRTTKR
ncbi:MAG: hypothetical protein JNM41_05455 [Flavipsychrobacter sp.]|nr:hypothetical protein [Flavipsychrobacter sp.]